MAEFEVTANHNPHRRFCQCRSCVTGRTGPGASMGEVDLAGMRKPHRQYSPFGHDDDGYCVHCKLLWPCDAIQLADEVERLRVKVDSEGAVLAMTVDRLGGMVEGRATIRLNFLQRIDELRNIEHKWRCTKDAANEIARAALEDKK